MPELPETNWLSKLRNDNPYLDKILFSLNPRNVWNATYKTSIELSNGSPLENISVKTDHGMDWLSIIIRLLNIFGKNPIFGRFVMWISFATGFLDLGFGGKTISTFTELKEALAEKKIPILFYTIGLLLFTPLVLVTIGVISSNPILWLTFLGAGLTALFCAKTAIDFISEIKNIFSLKKKLHTIKDDEDDINKEVEEIEKIFSKRFDSIESEIREIDEKINAIDAEIKAIEDNQIKEKYLKIREEYIEEKEKYVKEKEVLEEGVLKDINKIKGSIEEYKTNSKQYKNELNTEITDIEKYLETQKTFLDTIKKQAKVLEEKFIAFHAKYKESGIKNICKNFKMDINVASYDSSNYTTLENKLKNVGWEKICCFCEINEAGIVKDGIDEYKKKILSPFEKSNLKERLEKLFDNAELKKEEIEIELQNIEKEYRKNFRIKDSSLFSNFSKISALIDYKTFNSTEQKALSELNSTLKAITDHTKHELFLNSLFTGTSLLQASYHPLAKYENLVDKICMFEKKSDDLKSVTQKLQESPNNLTYNQRKKKLLTNADKSEEKINEAKTKFYDTIKMSVFRVFGVAGVVITVASILTVSSVVSPVVFGIVGGIVGFLGAVWLVGFVFFPRIYSTLSKQYQEQRDAHFKAEVSEMKSEFTRTLNNDNEKKKVQPTNEPSDREQIYNKFCEEAKKKYQNSNKDLQKILSEVEKIEKNTTSESPSIFKQKLDQYLVDQYLEQYATRGNIYREFCKRLTKYSNVDQEILNDFLYEAEIIKEEADKSNELSISIPSIFAKKLNECWYNYHNKIMERESYYSLLPQFSLFSTPHATSNEIHQQRLEFANTFCNKVPSSSL